MKKALSYLVGFLFLITVFLYFGGLLSTVVSPTLLWPLAFLGLGFPISFFCMILFLIYWIIIKSKNVIYPIFLLAAGFFIQPNFFNFSPSSNKEKSAENELKIMSYNVRIFERYESNNREQKRDQIIDLIKEQNPDILCLQEAINQRNYLTIKELSKKINLPYYHLEVGTVSKSGSEFGVAILSKYPLKYEESYAFGSGGNVGTKVNVDVNGQPISVFNIHLESVNIERSYYKYSSDEVIELSKKAFIFRMRRIARQLKAAFASRTKQAITMHNAIRDSEHPVILCGDFNDTPVSYSYKTVKGNLQDTFKAGKFGLGPTLPAIPLLRIDHIFASHQFKVLSHRIIKKEISDHYPVVAKVKIKQ